MKAFVFAWALGIVGASVAVACATTVVSGNAGGAAGRGVGGAGAAGGASGGGTSASQGVGGDGLPCEVYEAGVGDAGDVWGCDPDLGLLPPSECSKHGNECTFCEAALPCGWVGQYFDCGGCAWGYDYDCEYDPPPDHACSFDHGWGPVPTDPTEYWEVCQKQECLQLPDGHYNCCDYGAPIVASGSGKKAFYLHCPCE